MTEDNTTTEETTESASSSATDVAISDRNLGVAAHLLGPMGWGFTLGGMAAWIGPLLMWILCERAQSEYGKEQAKQALNLQLHVAFAFLIIHVLQRMPPMMKTAGDAGWSWIIWILLVANIAFAIWGAIGAGAGQRFKHMLLPVLR